MCAEPIAAVLTCREPTEPSCRCPVPMEPMASLMPPMEPAANWLAEIMLPSTPSSAVPRVQEVYFLSRQS